MGHKTLMIIFIVALAAMYLTGLIIEPYSAIMGTTAGAMAILIGFRYFPAPGKRWIAGPKNFYLRRHPTD